jgi:hypothetical protein
MSIEPIESRFMLSTVPFERVTAFPQGPGPFEDFFTADINGDHREDLIIRDAPVNQAEHIRTFISNGHGRFGGSATTVFSSPTSFDPEEGDTVAVPIGGFAAADFTGDGTVDIAVECDAQLTIFSNSGSGPMSQLVRFAVPVRVSVFAADFNGDGAMDLAFSGDVSGNTQVFYNDGDGSNFSIQRTINGAVIAGDRPTIADFNRDGRVDLLLFRFDDHAVHTLLATRKNSFAEVSSSRDIGKVPNVLTLADVDGDHRKDLLIADDQGVRVALARSGGRFTRPALFDATTDALDLLTSDFDRDGRADVLIARRSNPSRLIFGHASGEAAQSQSVDFGTTGVFHTSDLNRDGFGDVMGLDDNLGALTDFNASPGAHGA